MKNRKSAFAGRFGSQITGGQSKQSARRRVLAEPLEARVLLSTIGWSGGAGDGNFDNPDNWQGGVVPGATDAAVIDSGSVTITSGNSDPIAGLEVGGQITLSGAVLEITSSITGDGTIDSAGNITSGAGGEIRLDGNGDRLTIGNGVTLQNVSVTTHDKNTSIVNYGTIDMNEPKLPGLDPPEITFVAPFSNYGTVEASQGGIIQFGGQPSASGTSYQSGTLNNYGAIISRDSSGIFVDGNLNVYNPGYLSAPGAAGLTPPGSITCSGNLLTDTQNLADFNMGGQLNIGPWASFVSHGTASEPQEIEAMSQDLGPGSDGFVGNFAYGTISLQGHTYARLVDDYKNIALPEAIPEAVYVNRILVTPGSTLDLNGLNLYTYPGEAGIAGKVINGKIILEGSERLKIASQPAKGVQAALLSPAIKVEIITSRGQLVTAGRPAVQLSIASGPAGGVVTGITSAPAIAGVATFGGLTFSSPGTYVLAATTGSLKVLTRKIVIAPLPAVALAFLQPPPDAVAGSTLAPMVTVQLLDKNGQPALATRASTVRLSIASGPARGRLLGSSAVTVNGVATFSHLVLRVAGSYVVTASDGALNTATSQPFAISPAAPSAAKFIAPPENLTAGSTVQFAVELLDRYGNVAPIDPASLVLNLTQQPRGSNAGSTLVSSGISGGGTLDLFSDQLLTAGVYVFTLDDLDKPSIHPKIAVRIVMKPRAR
jgi:hypothetical protein